MHPPRTVRPSAFAILLSTAAFWSSSCKKDDLENPSHSPPAASAPKPATADPDKDSELPQLSLSLPVPGSPVPAGSGPLSTLTGDPLALAARTHFDATVQQRTRQYALLHEALELQIAAFPPEERRKAREKQIRPHEVGIGWLDFGRNLPGLRAQWEAVKWQGYPLPEKPDPDLVSPPITRMDVANHNRQVPAYLPASARSAWADFWTRADALWYRETGHEAVEEARSATALAINSRDRAEAYRRAEEAEEEWNKTLKGPVRKACDEKIIALANAWRLRNWEGYAPPSDPEAPPPSPPGK